MEAGDYEVLTEIMKRIPAEVLVRTRPGRYRRLGRDSGFLRHLCATVPDGADGSSGNGDEFALEFHSSFLENFNVDADYMSIPVALDLAQAELRRGATQVKIMASGGVASPSVSGGRPSAGAPLSATAASVGVPALSPGAASGAG